MSALPSCVTVAVIGAGTMGAGIAQVAAAAGHPVLLYDAMPGAASKGRERTAKGLQTLVARGRLDQTDADAVTERIAPVGALDELSAAGLVIEAIVEDLAVKQELVASLEAVLATDAIIATNTSSISITAIARHALHPGRIAGMHFFNPAPLMKLVEVVSGVATDRNVADTLFKTASGWGKKAVHAKSTPGFIVNRVARAYYAEALRLLEEQVADPATLDAIMTEGAGFRMGPFALMDLIGHDVNYAVSVSVFDAYYQEPRFRPSIVQLELVNAGRLGRKSGRGFFDYGEGAASPAPSTIQPDGCQTIADLNFRGDLQADGVLITRTNGQLAAARAGQAGMPVLLFDLVADTGASRIAFTTSACVPEEMVGRFVATARQCGMAATRLPDWPGLVAMRTVAMLANEAFEAVMQGVAHEQAIDTAMKFGVNYPHGPVEWARSIGLGNVVSVLDSLHALTGDPRYRCSLGLRLAAMD